MSKSEEFHVTAKRDGGVYGHSTNKCDAGGCAAGSELYLTDVDPDEVEIGHVYAIASGGRVLGEVED